MKYPPIHPIVLEVYADIVQRIAPSDEQFANYLRQNFSELVKNDSAEFIYASGDFARYIRYSMKVLKDIESTKAEYFLHYILHQRR